MPNEFSTAIDKLEMTEIQMQCYFDSLNKSKKTKRTARYEEIFGQFIQKSY